MDVYIYIYECVWFLGFLEWNSVELSKRIPRPHFKKSIYFTQQLDYIKKAQSFVASLFAR